MYNALYTYMYVCKLYVHSDDASQHCLFEILKKFLKGAHHYMHTVAWPLGKKKKIELRKKQ